MLKLFSALATALFKSLTRGSDAALGGLHQERHGGVDVLTANQVADDLDLAGRDADISQICFSFHVLHSPSLFRLGMAAERTGGSELAQLVADHIFLNINGNVLATVVDGDRVTDEGGEDGGAAAPGLQDLLLTGLVHLFDSLDQLRGNKRAFF